jgi:hypothetical protein
MLKMMRKSEEAFQTQTKARDANISARVPVDNWPLSDITF